MDRKDRLIAAIIQKEEDMFTAVRTPEPSACQDQVKTFRLMREMSHSVFPEQVLEALLQDLSRAEYADRNLMTEKYARMENHLPGKHPLIPEIVTIESQWQRAVRDKYPLVFQRRSQGFERYMSCELQTLSHDTLELYYGALILALSEGRNLAAERYDYLFRKLGYASLDAVEKQMRRRSPE